MFEIRNLFVFHIKLSFYVFDTQNTEINYFFSKRLYHFTTLPSINTITLLFFFPLSFTEKDYCFSVRQNTRTIFLLIKTLRIVNLRAFFFVEINQKKNKNSRYFFFLALIINLYAFPRKMFKVWGTPISRQKFPQKNCKPHKRNIFFDIPSGLLQKHVENVTYFCIFSIVERFFSKFADTYLNFSVIFSIFDTPKKFRTNSLFFRYKTCYVYNMLIYN